jgi:hypothetical protein
LLDIVQGTPGVTPDVPTLTQTDSGIWQQALAYVTVGGNVSTITPESVEDQRAFVFFSGTVSASGIITGTSDKAANYTITASDKNTYIRSTGSAITITVPNVLAEGESVNFIQAGAGQITFAGSSVSILSKESKLKTKDQYSAATITKVGGAYYLVGDLD